MLPKIKKKISSFLLSEEGRIPKQSLLSFGSILSAAVIGGILATKEAAAAHTNDISVTYSSPTATGTHLHSYTPCSTTGTTSACFGACNTTACSGAACGIGY